MRSISRMTAWFTTLATAVGATVVLAGSPAAADGGGYWSNQCDYGRACITLSGGRSGPGGAIWNVIGCGFHEVNDYYGHAIAHGNTFVVYYRNNKWDRVVAWTDRGLDPTNVATNVWVSC
ncbi:hypothetical protein [Streptomyces sp. NPDC059398]|uniref:hypothetical protein n=1 Tax=Streptomyces sp. NPDC059398 TaxID=3346820 RepID=UPI0036A64A7E